VFGGDDARRRMMRGRSKATLIGADAPRREAVSSEGIGGIIRETYVPPSPNLPTSLLASHTSAAV
jgi:hypothetical protein